MTRRTRTLTSDEIEDYRRDGVVCLRGALGDDWVAVVEEAVDDAERRFGESSGDALSEPTLETSHLHAMNQMGARLEEMGADVLREDEPVDGAAGDTDGQFILVNNAVIDYPAVQQLAHESPLGELAARLFGADKVNFLFDQIFIKQPGAGTRTAFHQDWGYFHVDG
ncbi:phytanoyl-CoA dioxygenase family protein, partial [Ilumatobacter sp.]|uniref:phytanoyl-CoA dioxygenase family protein n=1 Tax=Ilumatobacter sp. TaxID=1967498 RepID=UPI003C4385A2